MSQERNIFRPETRKLTDVVGKGSLEQVKNLSTNLLLTVQTPVGDSMLRHAIYNMKNPDVFFYLYNEIFKPPSPDIRSDSVKPIILTAALVKNAPVLHFLAAKGADLRPVVFDNKKSEERSVFNSLGYEDYELLYEQLLAIEAVRKPELGKVHTHNMALIGKFQNTNPQTSRSLINYIGHFWSKSNEPKELTPRVIMEMLMTAPLREVKKINTKILRNFKSSEKDSIFSGVFALHFALKNTKNPDVFNYLYNEVAQLDSPNRLLINSVSLLVYAASFNNHSAITFLVEQGANLQDKDPYGKTALEIITACDPEFAKSLMLAPVANDDKTATLLPHQPSLPEGIRKRTTNKDKNYGDINAEDDLQAPLLPKISPTGSLSE